jgi:predicted DCC family thiol-disulfide oxidoreductase YuxK
METFKSFIIYDSDCGFCENSIKRLRSIVGEQINYVPRNDIADGDYGISAQTSNGAIQFVDSTAQVYSGAHAIFKALSYKAGLGICLKLYQYLPGFKLISEAVYKIIAKYRSQISKSCKTH